MSESMYVSISFNEITLDESQEILQAIYKIRGTKKGMNVMYDEPIPVEKVENA